MRNLFSCHELSGKWNSRVLLYVSWLVKQQDVFANDGTSCQVPLQCAFIFFRRLLLYHCPVAQVNLNFRTFVAMEVYL